MENTTAAQPITIASLERELDGPREEARRSYVELGADAYTNLVRPLATLLNLVELDGRTAVAFVLAELTALREAGFVEADSYRLTAAGKYAAEDHFAELLELEAYREAMEAEQFADEHKAGI